MRSHTKPEARGGSWKEPPTPEARARSQEEQPRSSTAQAQEGLEELSHVEIRNGGGKEIRLIQGKEQRLCFAGAAVKRYPHVQGKRNSSKMVGVARGIRGQTHCSHTHRKQVSLITLGPQPCLTQ